MPAESLRLFNPPALVFTESSVFNGEKTIGHFLNSVDRQVQQLVQLLCQASKGFQTHPITSPFVDFFDYLGVFKAVLKGETQESPIGIWVAVLPSKFLEGDGNLIPRKVIINWVTDRLHHKIQLGYDTDKKALSKTEFVNDFLITDLVGRPGVVTETTSITNEGRTTDSFRLQHRLNNSGPGLLRDSHYPLNRFRDFARYVPDLVKPISDVNFFIERALQKSTMVKQ